MTVSLLHRITNPFVTGIIGVLFFLVMSATTFIFREQIWYNPPPQPPTVTAVDVQRLIDDAKAFATDNAVNPSEEGKTFSRRSSKYFSDLQKNKSYTELFNSININSGLLLRFNGKVFGVQQLHSNPEITMVVFTTEDGLNIGCFYSSKLKDFLSSLDNGSNISGVGTIQKPLDGDTAFLLNGCHSTNPPAAPHPSPAPPAPPAGMSPQTSP